MEDQIIGFICVMAIFIIIGMASYKKRKFGENPLDAKYNKGRR